LQQACDRHVLSVQELHVVEQHPEIGLINAELALDRLRGESDLLAHHARPPATAARVLTSATA